MSRSIWNILFTIDIVLLILLVVSLPYVERGTPTFVITMISLVLIVVSLVGLAVVIRIGWNPFEE